MVLPKSEGRIVMDVAGKIICFLALLPKKLCFKIKVRP